MKKLRARQEGVTLVELIVTLTILAILASVIVPSAQLTGKRVRELELRRQLRTMRTAIDDYHQTWQTLRDSGKLAIVSMNDHGYPKDLETLVKGYDFGQADGTKQKFLRRIPVDPLNSPRPGEEPKWGLRSYKDEPDSTTWGGEDVFDVYSLSEDTAIDGSKYKDW